MNFKVAVIGLGVIGSSQVKLFGDNVYVTYDPKKDKRYPHSKIAECDFAVMCVPTPQGEDGHADLRFVWSALQKLPDIPLMIRSTVPPGTTAQIAASRPALTVHVPEFMSERPDGVWPESRDVPFMIIGGNAAAHFFFKQHIQEIYDGELSFTSATEAELVKYTANLYLATKVTFVNEIKNICDLYKADFRKVRLAWMTDPRAGVTHNEVHPLGGFGGSCFPKDLAALITAAADKGYEPDFLRAVQTANSKFRSSE